MRRTKRKLLRLGRWPGRVMLGTAVVAFALASVAGIAKADSIQYNLTQDGCTGGCNPGSPGTSMGTVVLTDIAPNEVQVTINLVDPLWFMSSGTGIGATIAFNLTGIGPGAFITAAGFTNPNFSPVLPAGPYPVPPSVHMSTFGYFDYGISLTTGTGGSNAVDASPLTFDIICGPSSPCSAFSVNSFAQQSTGGGFPAYFAVDVLNSNTGKTGAIGAVDPGTVVPETGTISLLGTGLLGLLGLALYRRRSTSA